MLQRIHVENYKCLRDVTVELGDFTVLIGPNDSGKTSFLDVIQTFGKLTQKEYSECFSGDRSVQNLVWRKDRNRDIKFEAQGSFDSHEFGYQLTITPTDWRRPIESLKWDGDRLFWTEPHRDATAYIQVHLKTDQGLQDNNLSAGNVYLKGFEQPNQSRAIGIGQALASSSVYQFDLDKLPLPSVPKPGIQLEPTGANLAAVLDIVQNSPDRSAFDSLQSQLKQAIPTLQGIVLPPAQQLTRARSQARSNDLAGAKAIEFVLAGNERPPVTIPASLASGGALLFTAFLTLAHTQTPDLLLFEEPENGLHPARLQMIVDILRKMSRGEIGTRKRQIVLTTHNPILLNYVLPEEVRVFIRDPETGTTVKPMTEMRDADKLLKEFGLGELWYLLGEQKLFEGQPA